MSASTLYAVTVKDSDDIGDVFYGTADEYNKKFNMHVENVEDLQHQLDHILGTNEVVATIVE